ncbi:MAG: DUF1465 family protein [Alphaproteobacteria bacterium]|nr:DUF1465 family protein [Alphaproteobacteria bacterium]
MPTDPTPDPAPDPASDPATNPAVAFLDLCYDEATALLVEARDYLEGLTGEAADALSPEGALALTGAMTLLTRRLTEAMAWLMLERAIAGGEVALAEARDHAAYTLSDGPDLVADRVPGATAGDAAALPLAARGLLDRSRRLYVRLLGIRKALVAARAAAGPAT